MGAIYTNASGGLVLRNADDQAEHALLKRFFTHARRRWRTSSRNGSPPRCACVLAEVIQLRDVVPILGEQVERPAG
jgi:hypothetical protein